MCVFIKHVDHIHDANLGLITIYGYREADRVILTMCQEQGAQPQTFRIISQQLGNKTPTEVSGQGSPLVSNPGEAGRGQVGQLRGGKIVKLC